MYSELQRDEVHLNIRRLALVFLLSTVLPLLVGVSIDIWLGTAPFATIIVGLISIPVSSIIVVRVTLAEFDLMIDKIAPVHGVEGNEPELASATSDCHEQLPDTAIVLD